MTHLTQSVDGSREGSSYAGLIRQPISEVIEQLTVHAYAPGATDVKTYAEFLAWYDTLDPEQQYRFDGEQEQIHAAVAYRAYRAEEARHLVECSFCHWMVHRNDTKAGVCMDCQEHLDYHEHGAFLPVLPVLPFKMPTVNDHLNYFQALERHRQGQPNVFGEPDDELPF